TDIRTVSVMYAQKPVPVAATPASSSPSSTVREGFREVVVDFVAEAIRWATSRSRQAARASVPLRFLGGCSAWKGSGFEPAKCCLWVELARSQLCDRNGRSWRNLSVASTTAFRRIASVSEPDKEGQLRVELRRSQRASEPLLRC